MTISLAVTYGIHPVQNTHFAKCGNRITPVGGSLTLEIIQLVAVANDNCEGAS